MIPIRDTAPRHRFPAVNIALIVLNILIFFYQQMLPPEQLYSFIFTYGTVPANLTGSLSGILRPGFSSSALVAAAIPLVTANFLHGGWLHLIGNMLYLWIFGDNIEGRFGHLKYLLLYLFMGAASQLFHICLLYTSRMLRSMKAPGSPSSALQTTYFLSPAAR